MKYSPKNIKVACDHKGLTHFGGVYFFHEFLRVMQLRHFLACHLIYPRRNSRYHLSQMIFALMYPIVLGLDRIETASFLRSNGTFQYLTGLPSFPDPQTLRRFLFHAPERFWEQLHRINDRLLQTFIHLPDHRSRLIFDLDSTVVTVFGHQDGAEVGYNRAIAENVLITHCCVWKPTLPTSGTPSSVAATLEPGTAPPNCSPPALPMSLPISAKCAYEPMQALGSIPSSTPSNLTPPRMPLSLV